MTILRLEDCKKLGYCHHGIRDMCALHGFDWWDFLENGIDVQRLQGIDDSLINAAIDVAIERERNEQ